MRPRTLRPARIALNARITMLLVVAACRKDPPEVVEARSRAAEVDQEIGDDLKAPTHAEAREWLARPSAVGFKASVREMTEIADAIYAAGAVKVYVVGISTLGERETAAVLAVQLPPDAGGRKGVFDWQARWAAAQDEKPVLDVGQKYLKIVLD